MCVHATLAYNLDSGSISSCTFVACLVTIVSSCSSSSVVTWIVWNPWAFVTAFSSAILGTMESHADHGMTSFSRAESNLSQSSLKDFAFLCIISYLSMYDSI